MTTRASVGYSYRSCVCQHTLPLHAIAADAFNVERVRDDSVAAPTAAARANTRKVIGISLVDHYSITRPPAALRIQRPPLPNGPGNRRQNAYSADGKLSLQ